MLLYGAIKPATRGAMTADLNLLDQKLSVHSNYCKVSIIKWIPTGALLWFCIFPLKPHFLNMSFLSQRWTEATFVSGPSPVEEVSHLDPGWGHSSRRPGDGRPDSNHHPQRVFSLHCPHHRPPPAQHHGQLQVSRCLDIHFTPISHRLLSLPTLVFVIYSIEPKW